MPADTSLVTDEDLILKCTIDSAADSNCACLLSRGAPQMNTDISGPGVRISFYLQAYFLSLLSARSGSLDEITMALYTLVATNIAMTIASFILGFKSEPTMSLHDAIVVLYLLSLSWISAFTSMPAYNRFVRSDETLKAVFIVQSYLILALALAILVEAPTYGSAPRCNAHAVAVIFKEFPAINAGRITACVLFSLVILLYTSFTFSDYHRPIKRWYNSVTSKGVKSASEENRSPSICLQLRRARNPQLCEGEEKSRLARKDDGQARDEEGSMKTFVRGGIYDNACLDVRPLHKSKRYDAGVFGTLLVELIVISVFWALFVMNTELVITKNRFAEGGDSVTSNSWQFGQILPMFLVILPFVNLCKAFHEFGLARRPHRKRMHRNRTSSVCRNVAHAASGPVSLIEDRPRYPFPAAQLPDWPPLFARTGTSSFLHFQQPPTTVLGSQPSARISLSINSVDSIPICRE